MQKSHAHLAVQQPLETCMMPRGSLSGESPTERKAIKISSLVAVLWIPASHGLKANKFIRKKEAHFLCTTT
jgi:hypothetical protein